MTSIAQCASHLQRLDLSASAITDTGLELFAAAFRGPSGPVDSSCSSFPPARSSSSSSSLSLSVSSLSSSTAVVSASPSAVTLSSSSPLHLLELCINSCPVSDSGFRVLLPCCPHLEILHARETRVTDAALQLLPQTCPALHTLSVSLSVSRVTLDGLSYLSKHASKLTRLYLRETPRRLFPAFRFAILPSPPSNVSPLLKYEHLFF